MNDALGHLAEHGILGLLLAISLVALYLKDRQLGDQQKQAAKEMIEEKNRAAKEINEEKNQRIKDAQDTTKLLMQVQAKESEAIHKLSEIIEWIEERDDDRRGRS